MILSVLLWSHQLKFVFIILVRSQEDFTDEKLSFSPEYTHQIFGEQYVITIISVIVYNLFLPLYTYVTSERIYGYLNLKIQVYSTTTLACKLFMLES